MTKPSDPAEITTAILEKLPGVQFLEPSELSRARRAIILRVRDFGAAAAFAWGEQVGAQAGDPEGQGWRLRIFEGLEETKPDGPELPRKIQRERRPSYREAAGGDPPLPGRKDCGVCRGHGREVLEGDTPKNRRLIARHPARNAAVVWCLCTETGAPQEPGPPIEKVDPGSLF